MKLIVFDTETTGLPKTREPAWKGPNNWPHIVSISWIVIENDAITKEQYSVVKPMDWVIPEESTKIHGITQTYAKEHGESLSNVMDRFWTDIAGSTVIAHNLQFDENVVANAMLWDLRRAFIGFEKKFCTMESSRIICKIPSP
jgi:DNA polymerase III epsilon subunit-like protein